MVQWLISMDQGLKYWKQYQYQSMNYGIGATNRTYQIGNTRKTGNAQT